MADIKYLTIKNAYFYYTQIKRPVLMYKKEEVVGQPLKNKEYTTTVLIPFSDFKALKKANKTVKALKNPMEYTAKEFESKMKIAPPTDDKYLNGDDEYTLFKVTAFTDYPDGEPAPRPKVLGVNGNNALVRKDKNGEEVGEEILIGNGSQGAYQVKVRPWTYGTDGGFSFDLTIMQVSVLVPYQEADERDNGFDMDEEEAGEEEDDGFDMDTDTDTGEEDSTDVDEDWDV